MNDREPAREACFTLNASHQINGEQDRSGWNRRKNVSRKFGLRDGKENNRDHQPATGEDAELQMNVRFGAHFPSLVPPDAKRNNRSCDNKGDPRNKRERSERDVVPEGLRMMIKIAGEAREI